VELYEAWGKPEKAAEWRAKPTERLGSHFCRDLELVHLIKGKLLVLVLRRFMRSEEQ